MTPRARTLGFVVAAALAAAGATIGVTFATRSNPPKVAAPKPRPGFPPLSLDLGLRTDPAARAINRGIAAYSAGKHGEALQIFERYPDLEAQIGAALSAWPRGSLQRLEALASTHPASAAVRLNLGIADFWAGKPDAAVTAWREAVRLQPDSLSAVTADGFLHPGFAPNLPLFVPTFPDPPALAKLLPAQQVGYLERRARAGAARDKLLYGMALQRLGRPVSAAREFDAAARLAPDDPDAQVAAAVGAFSKSDPTRAFGRLGPLTARFPHAATVRFHLGELLLWTRQVSKARNELRIAVKMAPRSQIGQVANLFLDRLPKAGTS